MGNTHLHSIGLLNQFISKHFESQPVVNMLEAGCGSTSHIEKMKKYNITGIDISEQQLERNTHVANKICGDIQNYEFGDQSFDMIICWYVLEHVKYPQKAIAHFIKALRPNGLIIIMVPNIWSVRGLITKFTPTWIHLWYYKYIIRMSGAGKNDVGPFKTYLKKTISYPNIRKIAKKNGMEVAFLQFVGDGSIFKKTKSNCAVYILQECISAIIYFVSLGKVKKKNDSYIAVLKKSH